MLAHSIQSADGTRLRVGQWSPDGTPKGHVLIAHGLAEHLGRYEHVAAALTGAGFAVTALEFRGHGESEGGRGEIDRFTDYVADLQAAAAFVRGPYLLVAHSMGGLVALEALRADALGDDVRALVLSNPLTGVAAAVPWVLDKAKHVLSKLLPNVKVKNPLDPKHISRDAQVVADYEADPLVFDTITPRWGTEIEATMERVHAHAGRFTVPVLALLGTADKVCDHLATRRLVDAWGRPPHEIQLYEGLYHEVFNEPEKDRVLADMIAWLDAQETA
ncbi:MAG: lysophospholipase [Alphaproteobacteria bacterium]|nr:lysophospholipase [Alphaproteobacteria bacterium]